MKTKKVFHQLLWTTTQMTFCRWLQLRYRVRLEEGSDPPCASPFILVANHGNFFDPFLVGLYTKPALHIMMNEEGFRINPLARWYLRRIGVYPKKKGAGDIRAMKKTISILKSGSSVLIFPEGQVTWDGETLPIYGGIERLIKRAKVPLVIMRLQGNFLIRPWWAEGKRRGRVSIRRKVVSADRLAEMSENDILAAVIQGIYNNDGLDEANRSIRFSGSILAEGLERLVWMCMHCHGVDTLYTQGDRITCEQCGNVWTIDAHCNLRNDDGAKCFNTLHAWVQDHKNRVQMHLDHSSDETILISNNPVRLHREDDVGGFQTIAEGTMTLTKSALHFFPSDSPEKAMSFKIGDMASFVIQKKDFVEFSTDDGLFRAEFTRKSPMKWMMYIRYLSGFEAAEKRGYI